MIKPIAASESEMTDVLAAVRLKRCSLYLVPPQRIERPSTSSTLPIIEPVIEAFTTFVSPLESAIPAMISSAALPNVALSNPPKPSPTRAASASVARPIQPATGMMPSAEQTKSAVGLMPPGQRRRKIASGTKIRSQSSESLSFKSLETSRLAPANQPVSSPVVAVVSTALLDELGDPVIFFAKLANTSLEMADPANGTKNQPTPEYNQTEIEKHERHKHRHHLFDPVITRRGDQRAQHGKRQSEHGDTGTERSQRSTFLSKEHLDLVEDDAIRRR